MQLTPLHADVLWVYSEGLEAVALIIIGWVSAGTYACMLLEQAAVYALACTEKHREYR